MLKEDYNSMSKAELIARLLIYEDNPYVVVYKANLDIIMDYTNMASEQISINDEDAEKKLKTRITASEAANRLIEQNGKLKALMNPAQKELAEQMDIGFAERMAEQMLERKKRRQDDKLSDRVLKGSFAGIEEKDGSDE